MMSYGKDERDVDKHLWRLPIPMYDPAVPEHHCLVDLGYQQFDMVASIDLDEQANFVTLRRQIRSELAAHPSAAKIGSIVAGMLCR